MSLMKMRQRMKMKWAESLQGREFRAPPSVGRILLHSTVAAILGGISLRSLLEEGQESAAAGVLAAAIFALLAHVNWQRLREAQNEGLLPRRILCPDCEAPIALNAEERRVGRFSCASCGEDFEIIDEQRTPRTSTSNGPSGKPPRSESEKV